MIDAAKAEKFMYNCVPIAYVLSEKFYMMIIKQQLLTEICTYTLATHPLKSFRKRSEYDG